MSGECKSVFQPGAAQHGNFINYYQFNPSSVRLQALESFNWDQINEENLVCLDIGCNSGDLTYGLHAKLGGTCKILAIDLDPTLIERANEKNNLANVRFVCCDVTSEEFGLLAESFLREHGRSKFDIIFMFSITMWIHLNNGDMGLVSCLRNVSLLSKYLVIEPQPWNCYKSAIVRMTKCKQPVSPQWRTLKIRNNVEDFIVSFVVNECSFENIFESPRTDWKRKIVVFKWQPCAR